MDWKQTWEHGRTSGHTHIAMYRNQKDPDRQTGSLELLAGQGKATDDCSSYDQAMISYLNFTNISTSPDQVTTSIL